MPNTDARLKVLLAVDDTSFSTAAVSLITQISWPANTTLYLLNLPEQSSYTETILNGYKVAGGSAVFSHQSATRIHSAQIAHQLKRHNLVVTIETEAGQSSDRILSRAVALSPDIIAVGMDEKLVQTLLSQTKRSLLITRPSKLVRPLSTLLVVDDNAASVPNLDLLCKLSLPNWAKITLLSLIKTDQTLLVGGGPTRRYVSTVEPPCHTCQAIGQLEGCGVRVWQDRRSDGSVDDILSTAQQEKSSLIVIGWSENNTQFIEQVVKDATCSVLVVRQ